MPQGNPAHKNYWEGKVNKEESVKTVRGFVFDMAALASEVLAGSSVISRLTAHLARRMERGDAASMERGDADSAGSTLRTIMVVIVVTAVVGAIGAAVRAAGGRAADCITNAGC